MRTLLELDILDQVLLLILCNTPSEQPAEAFSDHSSLVFIKDSGEVNRTNADSDVLALISGLRSRR